MVELMTYPFLGIIYVRRSLLNTVISNTAIGDCTKGGTEVSRDFQEYARHTNRSEDDGVFMYVYVLLLRSSLL